LEMQAAGVFLCSVSGFCQRARTGNWNEWYWKEEKEVGPYDDGILLQRLFLLVSFECAIH
jgi:hypothetical protein